MDDSIQFTQLRRSCDGVASSRWFHLFIAFLLVTLPGVLDAYCLKMHGGIWGNWRRGFFVCKARPRAETHQVSPERSLGKERKGKKWAY